MIKGINRQIIEITQTGNNYFERAWLVIKPEFQNSGASALEAEADRYLKNLKPPYSIRTGKALAYRILSLLFAAVAGGVFVAAIMHAGALR